MILFVGSVGVIVGHAKANQDNRPIESFSKACNDGQRASATNADGRYTDSFLQGSSNGLDPLPTPVGIMARPRGNCKKVIREGDPKGASPSAREPTMVNGDDVFPQGTSNARHVAILAGLKPRKKDRTTTSENRKADRESFLRSCPDSSATQPAKAGSQKGYSEPELRP